MELSAEREAVADACRRLADDGLVIGTAGNVSVRVDDQVVVTPTGGVFEELRPDEMTVVDLDGEIVDGRLAPTSEIALHLGVYTRLEWPAAVVHTHSPMGTALSCVLDELPAVHYQMLSLGGRVPVAPYATFGTEELAAKVLDALHNRTAALMRNHGAITIGAGLDQAVENALLLEWACTLYWRARMIGDPSVLDDEQLADVMSAVQERGYGKKRGGG